MVGGILLVATVALGISVCVNGQRCTTPNGERAQCISIYNCAVLYNAVSDRNPEVVKFLQESQCGFDYDPLVCCGSVATYQRQQQPQGRPTRPPNRGGGNSNGLLPDRNICGYQSADRIVGGTDADYDEFPWMALLQYRRSSGSLSYACGGALISSRYVLTAAHCVTGQITQKVGRLVNVRLGETDIGTNIDCDVTDGFRKCNKPPVDVAVEGSSAHQDYDDNSKNRYNDIGLVRLSRDVAFTEFVKPICLPSASEKPSSGEKLWVAGWGRTEFANFSPKKLKLQVPVVANNRCSNTFKNAGVQITGSQVCAGGEKDKDSCTGDSGGPLMYQIDSVPPQWRVDGVVSFGTRCGTENWPGVYTRVSDFVGWIQSNVRP